MQYALKKRVHHLHNFLYRRIISYKFEADLACIVYVLYNVKTLLYIDRPRAEIGFTEPFSSFSVIPI